MGENMGTGYLQPQVSLTIGPPQVMMAAPALTCQVCGASMMRNSAMPFGMGICPECFIRAIVWAAKESMSKVTCETCKHAFWRMDDDEILRCGLSCIHKRVGVRTPEGLLCTARCHRFEAKSEGITGGPG